MAQEIGGGRRLSGAHGGMTPEQFVFWLRGYMASVEGLDLAKADVKCIRDTLADVHTFNRNMADLDKNAKQLELFPLSPLLTEWLKRET